MAQTYNVQVEDSEGNKYCPKPDLLTTKEQLAANNAAGKSVDALVVKEINNNLGGCRLTKEGNDFYIIGADSVRKKLGSSDIEVDIRVKTSGAYPSQGVVVSISYDNKVSWKTILSLSLDCHSGGSAFNTTKSVKHTITAGS